MLRDRVRSSARHTRATPAFRRLGRGVGDAVRVICAVRAAHNLFPFRGIGPSLDGFSARARALARSAALTALEEPGAHGPAALEEEAERLLADLRRALGRAAGSVPVELDELSEEAMAHASFLLSEHALEHRAELIVGEGPEGVSLLIAAARPEQAYVWLLDALTERVEGWMEERPAAAFEREAARWWHGRWRAARPAPDDAYPVTVREREFSLLERPYMSLGLKRPLEVAMEWGALADAGPRQRRLARQLLRSVAGVWDVERREGARVVYVAPLDGTRLEVREHEDEPLYGPGAAVLGRLIPFGDGTWVRSPGSAVVVRQAQVVGDFTRAIAAELAARDEQIHRLAFLEATIQGLMGTTALPRDVRPPVSPERAGRMLDAFEHGIVDAGAAEEVTHLLDPLGPLPLQVRLFELPVDAVLDEFIGALADLAMEAPDRVDDAPDGVIAVRVRCRRGRRG